MLLSVAAAAIAIAGHFWLWRNHASALFTLFSFALACMAASDVLRRLASAKSGDAAVPQTRIAFPASLPSPGTSPVFRETKLRNAFTIDLEDYFHTEVNSRSVPLEQWDNMPQRIEYSVRRLLDLLDEHAAKATVFTLGWVAQKNPALIREVAARGHEIACHSFHHRVVSRMQPQEFRADTVLAKSILEDLAGTQVRGYRAPNFSITPGTEWAWDILAELGFDYDSSINPVWHKLYANPNAPRFPYLLPNAQLLEIPIATWRLGNRNLPIGGGAYLRLLPYPYVRRGLETVNQAEGRPATVYMHPWEIDYLQPLLPQDWKSRIRQTWGTATMEHKLARLLSSARYSTIADVYAHELRRGPLAMPALPRQNEQFAQVV